MTNELNLPLKLISPLEWTAGIVFLLALATRGLRLLQLPEWRNALNLCGRAMTWAGRVVAEATRPPVRHPRIELVATTLFSAVSYCEAIVLGVLVGAIAFETYFHDALAAWRYIAILLAVVALMVVAAMAFSEAERARVSARKLRSEW